MIDGSKPLENPRYERFACELAKGSSQYVAYHVAGFTPNRGNATRLNANESVKARVAYDIIKRSTMNRFVEETGERCADFGLQSQAQEFANSLWRRWVQRVLTKD